MLDNYKKHYQSFLKNDKDLGLQTKKRFQNNIHFSN